MLALMNLGCGHRRRGLWVLVLIAAWARVAAAQTEPRNVLLLYSYDREFGPHNAFASMFRAEMSRSSVQPIDFTEVSLQPARSRHRTPDESILAHLRSTFASRRLDLMVPIGGPAAVFAQQYRQQLFPASPMLLAAVDRRFLENSTFAASDTAVAVEHDPPLIVENILRLLPETTTLFVVTGASQLERFWLDELKRGLRRFERRLTFIWTNELSFAEMLQHGAALPPRSAIFYAILSVDAKGVPQFEERTLSELHAAANAPVFGLYTTQLGRGIVGGPLLSLEDLSRNAANAAVRMLRGEPGRHIAIPTQVAGTPTFDWRELRRWAIREDRLAPGSIVRFREVTVWQRYRRQLIAAATLLLVQALLVTVLLANVVARRRKERSLRATVIDLKLARAALSGLTRRLMQAHEHERARIAHDIHENLFQRLIALTLRLRSLDTAPHGPAGEGHIRVRLKELSDRLADLAGEMLSISDQVYARLELLGLAEAARSFGHELSVQHNVVVDFRADGVPDDLSTDIALALFRVFQEALTNAVKHAGVRRMSVFLRGDRDAIHLEVADEGIGFEPEAAMKSHGLGLIGMRERINLVGGECAVESRPGAGTRIRARVPLHRRDRTPSDSSDVMRDDQS
jgi:signal transduction histidine kinase